MQYSFHELVEKYQELLDAQCKSVSPSPQRSTPRGEKNVAQPHPPVLAPDIVASPRVPPTAATPKQQQQQAAEQGEGHSGSPPGTRNKFATTRALPVQLDPASVASASARNAEGLCARLRVRYGSPGVSPQEAVAELIELVESLARLLDSISKEFYDRLSLPPIVSPNRSLSMDSGAQQPPLQAQPLRSNGVKFALPVDKVTSATSLPPITPPTLARFSPGTTATTTTVRVENADSNDDSTDGPTPKRMQTVQFKETGAFLEFAPLEVDVEQRSDSPGSSNSVSSVTTPQALLSLLLQRKSVVMQKELSRTTDATGLDMVNDFLILEELGRGASGIVYFVLDTRSSQEYAMKELRRERFTRTIRNMAGSTSLHSTVSSATDTAGPTADQIHREVAIMKRLNHPNICRLHEVIDDPTTNSIFLIMDFVPGGSIAHDFDQRSGTCTPIPLPKLRRYTHQMISGLRYLHKQNITHRDIKPLNVLLNSRTDRVVLVDFGVSTEATDDGKLTGFEGTPSFMAPECFSGGPFSGAAADVWSLGVTLFVLACGCMPFPATTRSELEASLRAPKLLFPPSFRNAAWMDLLRKMLEQDPAKRITLAGVRRHIALDDDADDDGETCTQAVSTLEVSSAISARRPSHKPDIDTLRRVSLSLAHSSGASMAAAERLLMNFCGSTTPHSVSTSSAVVHVVPGAESSDRVSLSLNSTSRL